MNINQSNHWIMSCITFSCQSFRKTSCGSMWFANVFSKVCWCVSRPHDEVSLCIFVCVSGCCRLIRRTSFQTTCRRRGASPSLPPPSATAATTWTTWMSPGWSWSTTSSDRWVSDSQPQLNERQRTFWHWTETKAHHNISKSFPKAFFFYIITYQNVSWMVWFYFSLMD